MSADTKSRVTRFLDSAPQWHFALYSIFFSFVVYFCALAFRKPYTAALYAGTADVPFLPPIDYKILLVISQVLGYGRAGQGQQEILHHHQCSDDDRRNIDRARHLGL